MAMCRLSLGSRKTTIYASRLICVCNTWVLRVTRPFCRRCGRTRVVRRALCDAHLGGNKFAVELAGADAIHIVRVLPFRPRKPCVCCVPSQSESDLAVENAHRMLDFTFERIVTSCMRVQHSSAKPFRPAAPRLLVAGTVILLRQSKRQRETKKIKNDLFVIVHYYS